jgi:hypothetical protein
VYRTHATHSVMPVYTRSTFGTDGLAQPIGTPDTSTRGVRVTHLITSTSAAKSGSGSSSRLTWIHN